LFGAKSSLSVIPQFAIRRRIKKEQPHPSKNGCRNLISQKQHNQTGILSGSVVTNQTSSQVGKTTLLPSTG
jgi:hypothetical protein